MNDLMARLLGLRTLEWSDAATRIGFERPFPAWVWVTIGAASFGLAAWSYWRLTGGRTARGLLAAARGLLLVLLAVLISGPQLVKSNESVERDWLLVLADRSASMAVGDAPLPPGAGAGPRRTRDDQLREAVAQSWPMWSQLGRERNVVWLGFGGGAFDLAAARGAAGAAEAVNLGPAEQPRTAVGAAIDQALARAAARPVSGVVLLSDGKSTDRPSRAALRRLEGERIPVFVVPLGAAEPPADLAVRRADGPSFAFVNDLTPVRVTMERAGGSGAATGRVKLIDKTTGRVLDEQPVRFEAPGPGGGAAEQSVTLVHRPGEAGVQTWVVKLEADGPQLVEDNKTAELSIELTDRPLRVLYIDGYPRWEQRYLRSMLVREKSISCATLVLSPERQYLQEGDVILDALPDSPERWAQFDAVILGDVRPDVFTPQQLALLRDHIAVRGAGLIWVGGPGATPARWWTTPLADLLPFTKEAYDGTAVDQSVTMRPTPAAERAQVLRLADDPRSPWPAELADPDVGWSQLRWAQRLDTRAFKPAAEVLAVGVPADGDAPAPEAAGTPLLISMRYGAGKVLYAATDEIWRWRYARGEVLFERYWLQLVRMLGRESLSRQGRSAVLTVTPRRSLVDQPVRMAVELLDQALIESRLPSIPVRITRRGADAGEAAGELSLRPDAAAASPDGRAAPSRTYSAIWLPGEPGVYTVEPAEPSLNALRLSAAAEVGVPNDELRDPATDHALLASLAEQTGGRVLTPAELRSLPTLLPNRQVRQLAETAEPLWDTPLALILVLTLLTLEWVGRRLIRLI
ncbi:MAG: hypothetical protein IBJ11_09950 [Phycisphaerales bacterium]|nr:hypothetical protein [Phycisphaerales bacterium]